MKGKMTGIIAGTLLAITSTSLPASATVSNTNAQHLTGGQKSTLLLAQKGNTESGQSTIGSIPFWKKAEG